MGAHRKNDMGSKSTGEPASKRKKDSSGAPPEAVAVVSAVPLAPAEAAHPSAAGLSIATAGMSWEHGGDFEDNFNQMKKEAEKSGWTPNVTSCV